MSQQNNFDFGFSQQQGSASSPIPQTPSASTPVTPSQHPLSGSNVGTPTPSTPYYGGGASHPLSSPSSQLNSFTPNSNFNASNLGLPYGTNLSEIQSQTQPSPAPSSSVETNIEPQLQNIVSTVNMGCKLELQKIAMQARNAEYNPRRFAAVIMRIREPKTTALIFASGKMVCTGAKSEKESRLAARKFARIIQKLGFKAKFQDFKIQNIVGSCDVQFPIRLEGLAASHSRFSSYEPELFPGLIYRMVKPRIVLLIFVSGKIVLTGAKHREDITAAFREIYPVLRQFKKE